MAWFRARSTRLTASDFGMAHGSTPDSFGTRAGMISKKLFPESVKVTYPMRHGQQNEGRALKMFEDWCLKRYGVHPIISHRGLVVNTKFPFLGAFPDAIAIIKPMHSPKFTTLVEIKCRMSHKVETVPPYYVDQVQGQMAILEIDQCILFQAILLLYFHSYLN